EPALLARDAAQLIVRVGFVGVNLNRAREARLRFLVLSALLIDQSEIVMRRRISRIEGRGFEVSLEVFTRSLRACDITQKVSQQDDDQDQQERRREYERQSWQKRQRQKRQRPERHHTRSSAVPNAKHGLRAEHDQKNKIWYRHESQRGFERINIWSAAIEQQERRY